MLCHQWVNEALITVRVERFYITLFFLNKASSGHYVRSSVHKCLVLWKLWTSYPSETQPLNNTSTPGWVLTGLKKWTAGLYWKDANASIAIHSDINKGTAGMRLEFEQRRPSTAVTSPVCAVMCISTELSAYRDVFWYSSWSGAYVEVPVHAVDVCGQRRERQLVVYEVWPQHWPRPNGHKKWKGNRQPAQINHRENNLLGGPAKFVGTDLV